MHVYTHRDGNKCKQSQLMLHGNTLYNFLDIFKKATPNLSA